MARSKNRSVRKLFGKPTASRLDICKQMEGFDDHQEMVHYQRALALSLLKGSKRERRLGKILRSCVKANRCGSAACQICMRRMRIGFVAATINLIERLTGGDIR